MASETHPRCEKCGAYKFDSAGRPDCYCVRPKRPMQPAGSLAPSPSVDFDTPLGEDEWFMLRRKSDGYHWLTREKYVAMSKDAQGACEVRRVRLVPREGTGREARLSDGNLIRRERDGVFRLTRPSDGRFLLADTDEIARLAVEDIKAGLYADAAILTAALAGGAA